ncbi:hypothetical protein [Halorussus marinus]|uniref:hypothetical protein n=1 Tax=Halorussus marinus TaxID=2505976 RepID=UPI00106EE58A|nr:hypothetical protein [Halorussus marinus]
MDAQTEGYAAAVSSETETYLDRVADCAGRLPGAINAYGVDDDAFATAVDDIAAAESDCDDALRELRRLLSERSRPNYTDVYLRADDVARLYAAVDEIPNAVERFARELRAIAPSLGGARAIVEEMASLAVEATEALAAATGEYVESLLVEGGTASVGPAVEEIRALESAADRLKYEGLAAAFDEAATPDALVVRELVVGLDAAIDAVEDAADQLLVLRSGKP